MYIVHGWAVINWSLHSRNTMKKKNTRFDVICYTVQMYICMYTVHGWAVINGSLYYHRHTKCNEKEKYYRCIKF